MCRVRHRQPKLLRPHTYVLAPSFPPTRRQCLSLCSPHNALLIPLQVPVILIGNKIDLRGGEVTNEALEDEIVPIMNEFKASSLPPSSAQHRPLPRKSRPAWSAQPRCLSTSLKSSTSHKRLSSILPLLSTTRENMCVILLS